MPTTDPNADLAGYIREVMQESATPGAPTNGAPASTAEPLTFNIAGQQYSYKTKAELEQALNGFVTAAGQKVGELQSQIQSQAGSYVTDDTDQQTPQWSDEEFVKRMTASPKEGLSYWLNQEIFGGQSENPTEDIKRALTETELTKRSIAAYQFKENHPEFPGGKQHADTIDNVRQQMGLPYDLNGIEAAYLVAQQRGFLPNFTAQAQQTNFLQQQAQALQSGQVQDMSQVNPYLNGPVDPRAWNGGFGQVTANTNPSNPYANNPYLQAPPSVNRNAPYNFGPGVDPEAMSIEQIEQVFQRAGQPIQRR